MTTVQKVYRILREHVSREEARYAAPRLAIMTVAQMDGIRAFGA